MQMSEMVKAVRAHALANYENEGWDEVVEAWDDSDIIEVIEFDGTTNERGAIRAVATVVKLRFGYAEDIRAAGR